MRTIYKRSVGEEQRPAADLEKEDPRNQMTLPELFRLHQRSDRGVRSHRSLSEIGTVTKKS